MTKNKSQASLELVSILAVFLIVFVVLYGFFILASATQSEKYTGHQGESQIVDLQYSSMFVYSLGPGAKKKYSYSDDFSIQTSYVGVSVNTTKQSFAKAGRVWYSPNASILPYGEIRNTNNSIIFR
jgi:competence protein ComGC